MPLDAQRRQDEYQNEYYTALFASDELKDELEDGLGVYVLKEPIGEMCGIQLIYPYFANSSLTNCEYSSILRCVKSKSDDVSLVIMSKSIN